MLDHSTISFGLRLGGFTFGPVDTVLLVVCLATALVSVGELVRLRGSERLQRRVAILRGTIASPNEIKQSRRPTRAPWYDRIGELIAKSPLVGGAEQERLIMKLAAAGIAGPGRLTTFIAARFLAAILLAAVVGGALVSTGLLADMAVLRYFAMAFGAIVGWRVPDVVVSRLAKRRKARLEIGFPDALDMLVICAESGLGLEQAMGYVAEDMRLAMPEVAEEFAITQAEMRVLADRRAAMEHLAARTGLATLQALVAILNQSVRFGTPLSDALRQLTAEARMMRMSRMEERAGRLAVTLLLPVMGFILPSLILVICGPVALRAVDLFTAFMSAQ